MKSQYLGLLLLAGVAYGQFGNPNLNWGSPSNIGPPSRPQGYGKPPPGGPGGPHSRPYSGGPPPPGANYPPPGGNYPPPGQSNYPARGDYNDDPIPSPSLESTYDTQQLPAKLPILAPNGVVEIYNRVVDDLIRKLEVDLSKKALDPMMVVIRPTPPGPVRVPGYLQKRPYRRPGAALYRSNSPVQPPSGPLPSLASSKKNGGKKRGRAGVLPPETRFGESRPGADGEAASVRGAGKISKGPLEASDDDEKEILESTSTSTTTTTTTTTAAPVAEELPEAPFSTESSEEDGFMKTRSDEFFPEPEEEEETQNDEKKEKPVIESEEVEEETEDEKPEVVDSLMQQYQLKNSKTTEKYAGKKKGSKPVVVDPSEEEKPKSIEVKTPEVKEEDNNKGRINIKDKSKKKDKKKKPVKQQSEEADEEDNESDEDPARDNSQDSDDEEFDDAEPGTGGGKRPQGGYYPPRGPPAIPAKPNAEMTGLSRIKRASDVSVSVDARSAVITARLLVGPIHVVINDSSEPMEKNVKATIPELEAELFLMERHGVVFLQRFTLDRAYGQDVEISIPKSKGHKKHSKNSDPPSNDPNHPANVEIRRQTKMAAHISMEVVKLLRSGNLRLNILRTAQGSMSKLKLPIKKPKSKKKAKKDKLRRHN